VSPLSELESADRAGEYGIVIERLREVIASDRRTVLSDPWTQRWLGRRWRNLFVTEASRDPDALDALRRFAGLPIRITTGPLLEQVAHRFLSDEVVAEARVEMPPSEIERLEDTTLLFAPGLLTGLLPALAFHDVWPDIEQRFGLRVLAADSHPGRGCDANTDDVVAALTTGRGYDASSVEVQHPTPPSGAVVVMGYSKGVPDVLHTLATRPDAVGDVTAVISWAGAVGGSFIADDIYDKVRHLPLERLVPDDSLAKGLQRLVPVADLQGMARRLDEYDWKQAIHDLTTSARGAWMDAHAAAIDDLGIPFFSVAGRTSLREVPDFQLRGAIELERHDKIHDMQLVHRQAQVPLPMATELGVVHAHHWDMSYDSFPRMMRMASMNLDHRFARRAAVVALLQLMGELGLAR
jgi:hypothetical protein